MTCNHEQPQSQPLKVLHLHFGRDGGAERFFVNLVTGLAHRGVRQKTVMRPNRLWRPLLGEATDIIESHFRSVSVDRLTLPLKVRRLAARWSPDAVMAWTPKGCKLMPSGSQCTKIVRLGDYPRSLDRFAGVDIIVANTPGIAERVHELGWTKSTRVITNFATDNKVPPVDRAGLGIPPGATLVAGMGRFVKTKEFDVLIHAVKQAEFAYLLLIGDGDESASLKALVRKLGIEHRVRFTGWLLDPKPYLAASDIFALSSRYEPLGNVILEAWSHDVPVVSTRSEGPSWFMRNLENGLLVDAGDTNGFADAFRAIVHDPNLRRKLIKGGRATVTTRFCEETILDKFMEVFVMKRSSQHLHGAAA